MLDGNGNDVSQDEYHIACLNAFRYRSYYYDIETGLYYLESRYYDPEVGRFINSDSVEYLDPETLGGLNLYAYCNNNPVMNVDPSGTSIFAAILIGALIGGLTSAITKAVTDIVTNEDHTTNGWSVAVSFGIGAITGGLMVAFPTAAIAISSVSSAAESLINDLVFEKTTSILDIIINATVSAGLGAVTASGDGTLAKTNIYDEAVEAIPRMLKGNHPTVKKVARKTFKKAGKQLMREYGSSQGESLVLSGVSGGTQWFVRSYVDRCMQ